MKDRLEPRWNEQGLAPTIVQDARTGEVLMLAWMNADAWRLTQDTGEAHFWSRSRQSLWHKGETSGTSSTLSRFGWIATRTRFCCGSSRPVRPVIRANTVASTNSSAVNGQRR